MIHCVSPGSRQLLLLSVAGLFVATSARAAQPFDCGPFLLQPGRTTMTVVIDHAEPVEARLTWQREDGGSKQNSRHETARHHIFALTDLRPDTHYRYRIEGDGFDSGERTFRTLPIAPRQYRFLAVGDVRSRPEDWRKVARRMNDNESEALFIVGTGDYPADGRQYEQWKGQFFDPARDLLARLPIWPAIGNHERTRQYVSAPPPDEVIAEEESHYFSLFDLPGNERWYRVDYQYLTLLVLDSNSQMQPGHEQYEWLHEQLRSARKRFTLVVYHHGSVTSGPHGRRREDGITFREWPADQIRRFLMPLYEMYGVDLVLNGHDHLYERSQVNGVYYVITGGGGAPLYKVNSSENPYQQVAIAAHHYSALDVTPTSITLTAIGVEGEMLDWFVIPVSAATATRMPRHWRDELLQTLTFEASAGASQVLVRNTLDFPIHIELANDSESDNEELAPSAHGELDLGANVGADSLLASPPWRGRVSTTVTVALRGDGDGIPFDVKVDEEVVLREAALVVAKMAAPEVDGLLDDWPSEGGMWIDSESKTIVNAAQYQGDADFKAHVRAGWSTDALHLALSIDDDEMIGERSASPWSVDGVELYIDGRDESSRTDAYTKAVSQNVLAAMRSGTTPEGNNAWREAGDLSWQVRPREGGYDMEVSIPATRIRAGWTPAVGESVRFDAMINDLDAEGISHHRLWSTGSASSSTAGFGVLILGE
ncbi:MAG TPA: hypothetical protein DIC52_25530 [Candidatus Latescibacteria bacterium]|nr:hypothetical protein [Candidatus Latescibacterota bacterium]|tara:strand:- start:2480 stop:4615 length:2136 start_codon:yes stop_codon:yes gene_type:complete